MAKANRKFRMADDREAEMGIGTMIIFIALVLVAAVAATLLITTASWVQQQAQETGRLAIKDVSTGLRVIDILGDRTVNGAGGSVQDTIQVLRIKVGLDAGSPVINLSTVMITITDGDVEANLNYSTALSVAQMADSSSEYIAEEIRDPDNTFNRTYPMISQGGIVELLVDANDIGLNLTPQTQVTVYIIPNHGVSTYEVFTTPSDYTHRYIHLV
ncbi:MAG: flagellin [Thermoproteota archaeon]|nr:MAG: flagellin [Candidatus Korarchaeota archaeon]